MSPFDPNAPAPGLVESVRTIGPRRVAVIGDLMLDRYVRGQTQRLSPEAPIPVLDADDEREIPGGAANVAMKVAELGSSCRLIGLVGADAPADALRKLLDARAGVDDGLVVDPGRSTTVKTRFIAHNQQLLRVDRECRAAPSGAVLERLAAAAFEAAIEAEAVILEDYGKGVLAPEVIAAALRGARESGAPVVVDPNGRDYRRYAGATILTPNLREAEIAAEMAIAGDDDLRDVGRRLVAQTDGAMIAVTREAAGISLFRPDPGGAVGHTHIPTSPVAVFDVTGAGDAVAAALAIAMASGVDPASACGLANLAGRAVVRQYGVGTISMDHLVDEAHEITGRPRKVVDLPRAVERAEQVRRSGGRVVFTNGCFDLLHYGHAFLLQYARARGDLLILGLNTDRSIRRQKGADRPVVPEQQRSYMLSLYPFVDLVVPFDDDTPLALIEAIRPDVLVKGGDYTPETVVGREVVEATGGEVLICPRLEGFSTTELVRKIQAA